MPLICWAGERSCVEGSAVPPVMVTSVLRQTKTVPNHLACCIPSLSYVSVLREKKDICDHTVGASREKNEKVRRANFL